MTTITRRRFLAQGAASASFLSLASGMPGLFARAAELSTRSDANDHTLVVVELSGGNDGLNTLIPFEDRLYFKHREKLGVPAAEVVRLNDHVGLHPRMTALGNLFKEGELAIVQGVGYPQPDRSHFRSMEIWQTASVDSTPPTSGWLGRYLDALPAAENLHPHAFALNSAVPQALLADHAVVADLSLLEAITSANSDQEAELIQARRRLSTTPTATGTLGLLRRQADALYRTADQLKDLEKSYKSSVEYPDTDLARQLRKASSILAGRLGVRVLYVAQDGYDTHSNQAQSHADLLGELSDALQAFRKDLNEQKLANQVTVMVFSEFGRRVQENASGGTDHGAASNLFVLGSMVKGGLYGKYPSLDQLDDGDLIHNTDFRSVYASLLGGWMGVAPEAVLGKPFPAIDLVKTR